MPESVIEKANKVERRVAALVIESLSDALIEALETTPWQEIPHLPFLKRLAETLSNESRVIAGLPVVTSDSG